MGLDTQITIICDVLAKLDHQTENYTDSWRPFCFLAIKKIPQGCQAGTRLNLTQDGSEITNQPKKFILATMHAYLRFRWTMNSGP